MQRNNNDSRRDDPQKHLYCRKCKKEDQYYLPNLQFNQKILHKHKHTQNSHPTKIPEYQKRAGNSEGIAVPKSKKVEAVQYPRTETMIQRPKKNNIIQLEQGQEQETTIHA